MGAGYSLIALPQWYVEGAKWYGRSGFQRSAATWADRDLQYDMRGKVVICTGANSGCALPAPPPPAPGSTLSLTRTADWGATPPRSSPDATPRSTCYAVARNAASPPVAR